MTRGCKLALFGPPLAGKRTLVEAVARSRNCSVERFEVTTDCLGGIGGIGSMVELQATGLTIRVCTLSGGVWDRRAWDTVIANAERVILVLDSQWSREDADREHISTLSQMPRTPNAGCVVWTKDDLTAAGTVTRAADSLLVGTPFEHWKVFASRLDYPSSLVRPIDWILADLARGTP